ncbi:MAG: hypothetical protein IT536_17885, partial [Hyphomicrobiales bacterium]|nr:hypothetical protein [Hyphomicrobiales bacterium]
MSGSSPIDWALGTTGNAAWDLVKVSYAAIKKDLGRRITRDDRTYDFDVLDKAVGDALDILSGSAGGRLDHLRTLLHQRLVNVPANFGRADIRGWLNDSGTRRALVDLVVRLLSKDDLGPHTDA